MADLSAILKALDAIRDLVAAGEEAGWDLVPELREVLEQGRSAHTTLRDHFGASETVTAVFNALPEVDEYAPQSFDTTLRSDDDK